MSSLKTKFKKINIKNKIKQRKGRKDDNVNSYK